VNLNLKLQLVTIIPLVLALSGVLFVTQVQYQLLSKPTVETHTRNINLKLGINSTLGLMRYALDYGLER